MGVELIIIVAGRVGVMEGSGLFHIHLHLVQKQIVFVPLYFSIDHYLSFVSVPLPNGPRGCENVGLRAQWNGITGRTCVFPSIPSLKSNTGAPVTTIFLIFNFLFIVKRLYSFSVTF